METNFIFFGICLFGGMVIGALLCYGLLKDAAYNAVEDVIEENYQLKKLNSRLQATLRRVVPDQSLWGFTKGAERR